MNPILSEIPPSLIRALNAKKGPGDVDLGLGEPVVRPAIAPFEAAVAWVAEHGCPYTPNAGALELRLAIAEHYRYPGLTAPENVCVTVGSQEALYLAVKALIAPAKDEVLVVAPAYPAYAKICQMEGIRVRRCHLDTETGFAPDAERVLAALGPDTALVLLASPANPTGRVWQASELAKLARGLEAHERSVYALVDEVYRELTYGEPYTSLAELYPRTLVANSLSKSHALTGLRLGWLLGPAAVMPAVVKVHQFINTAASTFSQRVAIAVFAGDDFSAHRALYAEKRRTLLALLDEHGFRYVAPEGGFYCMVALGEPWWESVATAHRVLDEAHVVTVPGAAFEAEGWLRLSWVADEAALAEGLRRLAAFL